MSLEKNGIGLQEAYELINGARQEAYGKPWDNFGLLAEFFTSYSRKRWGVEIEFLRTDVVNFLELLKLSRACVSNPTCDTYIDIAGYAGLGGDFALRQRGDKVSVSSGRSEHVSFSSRVSIGKAEEWNTEEDFI